jgi:hypothetical protein
MASWFLLVWTWPAIVGQFVIELVKQGTLFPKL